MCCILLPVHVRFFLVRIYPSALFSVCAFFRVRFFPSAFFSHAFIYTCAFFLCAFFQCAFFRSPVGRRKEPILGYVPKTKKKKKFAQKGLGYRLPPKLSKTVYYWWALVHLTDLNSHTLEGIWHEPLIKMFIKY